MWIGRIAMVALVSLLLAPIAAAQDSAPTEEQTAKHSLVVRAVPLRADGSGRLVAQVPTFVAQTARGGDEAISIRFVAVATPSVYRLRLDADFEKPNVNVVSHDATVLSIRDAADGVFQVSRIERVAEPSSASFPDGQSATERRWWDEPGRWSIVEVGDHAFLARFPTPASTGTVAPRSEEVAAPIDPRRHPSAVLVAASTAAPGTGVTVAWVLLFALGAALGVAGTFALFSRFHRSDVLRNARRSRLFEAVNANPGITFGALQTLAGLANGAAQHHLRLLEIHGLVTRARDGRTTRFFPTGPALVPTMRLSDSRARIVEVLRERPGATVGDVASRIGHRAQSVWRHVRLLERMGFVEHRRIGHAYYWSVRSG